jgi:hypothetical protein
MKIKTKELIKHLNKGEIKGLKLFLASPFHNKNKKLSELLNALISEPNIGDKGLFERIFKTEPYNKRWLYDAFSQLGSVVLRYVAIQRLEKDNTTWNTQVLKGFIDVEDQKNAAAFAKHILKSHRAQKIRDEVFLKNSLDLTSILYEDSAGKRTIPDQDQDYLQKKMDDLDLFYFLSKIKSACEMYNRRNIVNQEYRISFIAEIEDFIKDNNQLIEKSEALRIYLLVLKMVRDDDEHAFQTLELHLNTGIIELSAPEQKDIYNHAQNFCIRRANKGNSNYLGTLFALYGLQIRNGIILQRGLISEWDYKTIVTLGLRQNKKDWTKEFIYAYKQYLKDSIKDNAFAFNLASFYYETNEQRKAIRTLLNVEFTDVYYNLGSRTLLLKVYFDLEDDEALESQFISFNYFLKRNKLISIYQRNVHLNLIKFARSCYKLRVSKPKNANSAFKSKVSILQTRIDDCKEINNLNWLKSRVQLLLE